MSKKICKFSLKYKISITILVVALIPLVILGGSIIKMYDNAIKASSFRHIYKNVNNVTARADSVFSNAKLCAKYIELMLDEIEEENNKQAMQNFLDRSVGFFDGIESVVYVTEEKEIYSSNAKLAEAKGDEICQSPYMNQLVNTDGEIRLFDKIDDCMETKNPVVTMGKKVLERTTGETTGYLFINISGYYLVKTLDDTLCEYLIFDNQGKCIVDYTNINLKADYKVFEEAYQHPESWFYETDMDKYFCVRGTIEEYGWQVIGLTSFDIFNVNHGEFDKFVLLFCLVILALMGAIICVATILITKPLLKLKVGAEEIANGNLDVNLKLRTRDEIGELGAIFNKMAHKIKDLLQKVDEEAKKKREYELALVHEQVKPHFLYNSLDIVLVLIEMKREKEAARVVKKLAAYYKNSLSSSEDIIPIETEIKIIEDYLELLSVRYGDHFTYEICVEDAVKESYIPRLTLQPLVENAIYHGLRYQENWGNILVEAKADESTIIIKIIDDGIGMDEKKLEDIGQFAEKSKKHFGLYSVNQRLKLYYGEKASLKIESEYGVGTCITIEIPRGDMHD